MKLSNRIALCVAALNLPLMAQSDTSELDRISVDGTRMTRSLLDTPAAVSVVDARNTQQGQQQLQLDESLARVPGLYLQNRYNFAQNQRLSIRGFGARAPFGVRGLRIRVDGFPETLPDGQSQVDSIDLDSLSQVTVLRGPASVLYGNATGGVIDIDTLSGRDLPGNGQLRLSGGGDGYRQAHLHSGGSNDRMHYYLGVSGLDYDGYRQQSAVEKRLLTGRIGWQLDPQQDIELFLSAMDTPFAQDPGGLTRSQVRADRRQASGLAEPLDAGQTVDQQRLGVRYRKGFNHGGQLQTQAFISRRDFEQQLPFPGSSLITFERLFYGVGVEYSHNVTAFNLPHRVLIGFDLDRQQDDRQRRSVNPSGEITGMTADEDQIAASGGLFIQTDTFLTDTLTVSQGVRADRIRFRIDDRLLDDGDNSGQQRFDQTSFSVGVAWQMVPLHTLYGSISSAFETPTFTELANPSGAGGFNPALSPQQALNQEMGLRGTLGTDLRYDLTLFRVRVEDEITPFERDGRTFFDNAAKTRREGLEMSLQHATTDTLTTSVAWTWAQYRFERFFDQQQNQDVRGNRLPGLPRHIVFAEAAWRPAHQWFVIADVRYASAVFAENTNDTRVGSHTVVNTRLGKRWDAGRRHLELHVGINNLLDRQYFSNIRINANSDRPLDQRGYFEPAPERTLYAGVTVGW